MTASPVRARLLSALFHPLTINLAVFFVLSLATFRRNAEFLFYGVDGRYEVTLIQQFARFSPSWFGFAGDPLRGLGNMVFPVNPAWIPGYVLGITWPGERSNFALTYAINSCELFVAAYAIARLMQVPSLVGTLAAWTTPLVVMPYFGFGLVPHTVAAFPHYATLLAVSAVLTVLAVATNPRTVPRVLLWSVLATVCVGYLIAITPTIVVLGAPLAGICMVIALIAADGRRQLFLRASTFGVIVLACLALYAPYLAGLFLDTAANFFRGLSVRPATLPEISLIFWPQFPVGRMLIVGGMCGALLCACLGSGRLRLAAVGLIITELLLLAIGALQFVSPFWFGPALWYFEGFLYLHFAVFLFAGPYIAVRAGGRLLTRLIPSAGLRLPMASSSLAWRVAGLGIAAVAAGYVLARGTTGTAGPGFIPAVQAETVITRTLKDEIGLDSDNRFRGRVADFFGRSMPANNNFNIWNYLRFFALRSTGNTHGGPGLWQDAIPTLTEYSPHMTPAYFAFNRRFFTLADDIQTRNWLHMRRIEPRLLALAGVRFVITDTKFEGAANLRAEIPIQVSGSVLKEFYAPGEFRKHAFSLHLYEIPNTNTGDYSPTVVRQATDAAEALGLLGAADFDPRHEVVTHEKIAHELMPATLQEFSVERGRFRVRATSPARSLLLLPIEFSRCLRISNEGPATGNESVRLVRADLLLTGLLFEKVVDIAVGYFNGPFSHPFCRLIDRREYQALSISDAFRHQPEFLPK